MSVSGQLAAVRKEGGGSRETNLLTLLDQKDVELTLQPRSVCSQAMVLMVLSAPGNTEKRRRMRERLAETDDIRLIFLLGASSEHQARLQAEHEKFDDIVQISVRDSYDTLSYKSLTGFIWGSAECHRAKYITKTGTITRQQLCCMYNFISLNQMTTLPWT